MPQVEIRLLRNASNAAKIRLRTLPDETARACVARTCGSWGLGHHAERSYVMFSAQLGFHWASSSTQESKIMAVDCRTLTRDRS